MRNTSKKLYKVAMLGNVQAQIVIANQYRDGNEVPPSRTAEVFWLRKAASESIEARVRLALIFIEGTESGADPLECHNWVFGSCGGNNFELGKRLLEDAARAGDAQALYHYARIESMNFTKNLFSSEIISFLQKSAELNFIPAKFALGFYMVRSKASLDMLQYAADLIFAAAAEGYVPAIFWSGVMWEQGLGVPVTLEAANFSYMRAASANFAPALFHLSVRQIAFGPLIEKDLFYAETLLLKAASQRYIPAIDYLIYAYSCGGLFGINEMEVNRLAESKKNLNSIL